MQRTNWLFDMIVLYTIDLKNYVYDTFNRNCPLKTFEMSLLPTFPYLHSIGIALLKTFEMCLSELWSSTMQNHFYVDVVTNRPALHWSEDTCNGIDNIDGKTGRNIQTNIHPLKF